jgi:hypothetical protein
MKRNRRIGEWGMRLAAIALIGAIVTAYFSPPGKARYVSYSAIPVLIVLFLAARGAARPDEDFADTPWGL